MHYTKPPIFVVYKIMRRKKEIITIVRFDESKLDDVIDGKIKEPFIPEKAEVLEIGVGHIFEEKYKKKYKL